MSDKLEITKENLQKAYENACDKGKKVLEDLFPGSISQGIGKLPNGAKFWFVNEYGSVSWGITDWSSNHTNFLWEIGNYFYLKEEVELMLEGGDFKGFLPSGLCTVQGAGLKSFFKSWQRYFGIIE